MENVRCVPDYRSDASDDDPYYKITSLVVLGLLLLSLGFFLGSNFSSRPISNASYMKQDLNSLEVVQYPGNVIDPSVLREVKHWQRTPFGNVLPLITDFLNNLTYLFGFCLVVFLWFKFN